MFNYRRAEMKSSENSRMFNKIAGSYDMMNTVLSFGMDKKWRRKLVKKSAVTKNSAVLDIATGTGEQLVEFLLYPEPPAEIIGTDPAEIMLEGAKKKTAKMKTPSKVHLEQGYAGSLPYNDKSFDIVSCSFGVRNFESRKSSFEDIARVIKPGGKFLFLEFSLPDNPLKRITAKFYMRLVLPYLGGLLSGDFKAYRYLNTSVEGFPGFEEIGAELKTAGFSETSVEKMCFDIVNLYIAEKK